MNVAQTIGDGMSGESGEVYPQYIQYVTATDQENIDPQNGTQQILMVQPITITADGQLQFQDGQQLDASQVQILAGDQQIFDTSTLTGANFEHVQLDDQTLQQLQIDSATGQFVQVPSIQGEDDVTHVQIVKYSEQSDPNQVQLLQMTAPQQITPTALPIRRREPEIQPPVGQGPYPCKICGVEFVKWSKLRRHVKTHDDDKSHRCTECSVSFNYEENLVLHMATHDTTNTVCPECGKKFSRMASLKSHLMLHERDETLMCPECGDEFAVQSQLDNHLVEHRESERGERIYSCGHCPLQFSKISHLKEHSRQHVKIKASLHHKAYRKNIDRSRFGQRCRMCNKNFQKPSQLVRHMRIHTGERPFKCTQCDKAFNQKGALQIHMLKHTGEKEHICQFCAKKFAQKGNLRSHIQRVHSQPLNIESSFQCHECTCVFKKLGSLNAHMSREHSDHHEIELHMNVMGNTTKPREAQGLDMENSSVVNTAIQQLLELSEQPGAVTAVEANISEADIIKQALESSGLPSQFRNTEKQQLNQVHDMVNGHIMQPDTIMDMENVIEDRHVPLSLLERLPHSKKEGVFATMAIHDPATGVLKRHLIRKVGGVRWHQCTYCTKEFKKPSDLIRHVRIHTHEKPYKCTQCFRAFAVKSTLTAHLKTHSGVKDFRCQICEKSFSTHGSLKVHLRLHTGAKPFSCPHCDKRFRTSGHRKTHLESHMRDGQVSTTGTMRATRRISRIKPSVPLPDIALQEPIMITDAGLIQQAPRDTIDQYLGPEHGIDRPYRCNYCHRGFKKSSHLKQHVRSHTGEKPYTCLQCCKSFVSSGVLKAHLRTHTGIKAFRCMVCDLSFTTKGSLKRHISVHSEDRPFMCPYCQKTFKRAVYCKKHMKIHKVELAMQALQQQQQEQMEAPPETEVTIGCEDDDDDVGDVIDDDNIQFLQVHSDAVQAGNFTLQQDINQGMQFSNGIQLAHDTTVSQNDLMQLNQATHNPQQLLDTGLVTDVQLQSALQQQGLQGQQVILIQDQVQQMTKHQQQQQNFVTQQITQLSDGSYFVDTGPPQIQQINLNNPHGLDVVTLTNASGNAIDATNIQAILQSQEATEATLEETALQNVVGEYELEQTTLQEAEAVEDVLHEEHTSRLGPRNYLCKFCNKSFKKSSHLKQHLRMHTGDRPFKCFQCGKFFVSAGVLKAHLKTHAGMKEHHCEICDAAFTTNGSLTRHMVTHATQKVFQCPHCSETFKTVAIAKKHIKEHTMPPDMGDIDVPRRTRSTAVLRITDEQAEVLAATNAEVDMPLSEKILIESAGERGRVSLMKGLIEPNEEELSKHPNQCPHCTKSFKKPSDLLRHIRIHTGEKPFECEICFRTFTVKSTLDSHHKTHAHLDKTFRCHVCNSSFSTKGSLKVHMRLHTGAKPFVCPHCNLRFRTSGHRKSHVQQHYRQPSQAGAKKVLSKKPSVLSIERTHGQSLLKPVIVPTEEEEVFDTAPDEPQELDTVIEQHSVSVDPSTGMINPVLQLDPMSLSQAQGVLPVSLSITDSFGNVADPNVTAQVLQGLEGMQLQLTGGQGIQITGLDASMLTQPLQIDANLLNQLQGNVNVTIDPNMVTQQLPTADPNLVQNFQIGDENQMTLQTQQSMGELVNPNVIIQEATMTHPDALPVMHQLPFQHKVEPEDDTMHVAMDVGDGDIHSSLTEPESQNNTQSFVTDTSQEMINSHEMEDTKCQIIYEVTQEGDLDAIQQQPLTTASSQQIWQPVIKTINEIDVNAFTSTAEQLQQPTQVLPTAVPVLQVPTQSEAMNITFEAILDASQEDVAERIHQCTVCNKSFKRMSHLKEHLLIHDTAAQQRPKPIPNQMCPQCDKIFQKPSQLERHMRIHTGERPYQCDTCMKTFNQKNALIIHQKKHTGEKPHQCEYCGASFTQKGNLKTHVKRYHHSDMIHTMRAQQLVRGITSHSIVPGDASHQLVTGSTSQQLVTGVTSHQLDSDATSQQTHVILNTGQGTSNQRTTHILLSSGVDANTDTHNTTVHMPQVELDDLQRDILHPADLMPMG